MSDPEEIIKALQAPNKTAEKEIVVCFSGGKSSAYMVFLLENHEFYKQTKKHYVFANTGREYHATLSFIYHFQKMMGIDLKVIESKPYHDERKSSGYNLLRSVADADTEGKPFEDMVKKYGLPSVAFPHCSRELKINPIKAFIREHLKLERGNFVEAIGIRYDEPRRIRAYPDKIYPLYDFKITKSMVNEFWESPYLRAYTLGLEEYQGNCDLCFKKSWSKLKRVATENPGAVSFWADLEYKYSRGNGDEIFREHKTAKDLFSYVHDNESIDCTCHAFESN